MALIITNPSQNTDEKNRLIFTFLIIGICTLFPFTLFAEANSLGTSNKAVQRQIITKQEAISMLMEDVLSKAKSTPNPAFIEVMGCMSNGVVNEIFSGNNTLERNVFQKRFDDVNERMGKDDTKINFIMMKCVANSKEVEKAISNGLPVNSPNSAPPTPLMDIDDLRADIRSLEGKTVRVAAIGTYMMDSFFIRKKGPDASPVPIDITKLPRDQRREIINQCGDIMAGCRLTILGVVGDVKYRKGLIAQQIDLQ